MRHYLIRMHLLASRTACSSSSSSRIMNGRDVESASGEILISKPYSSAIESSSGIRNSSCTCAKTNRYSMGILGKLVLGTVVVKCKRFSGFRGLESKDS